MIRSDLAGATEEPPSQIEPFDFHGCICGVASFIGRPPWEFHSSDDELLHVLAGSSQLVRTLRAGDLVIIPKGCWHRNEAPEGVTMLHITPREGGPPLLGRSRILETRPILWRLATSQLGDDAPARNQVEHRDLLGDPQRIVMTRQWIAESAQSCPCCAG